MERPVKKIYKCIENRLLSYQLTEYKCEFHVQYSVCNVAHNKAEYK